MSEKTPLFQLRSPASWLPVGLIAAFLVGCATGPTYRPRGPGESVGYTDQRLTENRFRVTFTGTTGTRREQVEDYLLRRAAEVTLDAGYSYFVFDTRNTEARTYYRTTFDSFAGYNHWRYGPRAWYWSSFHFPGPYDRDVVPVTRYSAYSEIVMLRDRQAQDDPDAIGAEEILRSLTPPPPPPPPPGA